MRLLAVSRKSHFKMHRIEMDKYDSNKRKLQPEMLTNIGICGMTIEMFKFWNL